MGNASFMFIIMRSGIGCIYRKDSGQSIVFIVLKHKGQLGD